jgi:hypothetical protein
VGICCYYSDMMNHSTSSTTVSLSAGCVKWLVFGVALPLLPLAARVLTALLGGHLSFASLFGDGELLVIATVIAAAVIGDLLFESTDYMDTWSRIKAAILCAFALLIVVFSVLTYGLVAVRIQSGPYVGSDKAAVLSVIVFLLSFVVGAFALLFSLRQRGMQAKLLTAERSI